MVATDIHTVPALTAAEAFFREGDFTGALACLQETLFAESESAPLHVAIGYAHFQLGDVAPARHAFQRAAELDPRHAPAFVNLALVLDQLGELAAAAKNARQARSSQCRTNRSG